MSVHLHARSCYTLLNSTLTIPQLVSQAKQAGYGAIACTDEKVMHGAMEFWKCCQKEQIKPLFGLEIQVKIEEEIVAMTVLARDNEGYVGLMEVSSRLCEDNAQLTLDQIQPHLDHWVLIVYGEGGFAESELIQEDRRGLGDKLGWLKTQLPLFYMAISFNDASFWKLKNILLKQVCGAQDIPTVALSKIYYGKAEDAQLFKIVNGIRLSKTINDKTLPSVNGRYLRTPAEMEQLYDAEDLQASDHIASICNVTMELAKTTLPAFPCPQGVSSKQYLTQLCLAGLKKRRQGLPDDPAYRRRLKYELDVILTMHFEDYFLIVWDFIRFARKAGIYVGPGRGSAAGSLVAYVLGITHVDPLQYGLLFERFLNPERISMPDIDTDFPDNRRDEVIRYVAEKYGEKHVAHIATFGTLGAKQVLRDVGRVMEIPLREVDMLCKAVPFGIKMTLQTAIQQNPRFHQMVYADRRYQELFETALRIEGLPRHVSTHAAGIVFSRAELDQICPTIRIENDLLSTQYTMEHLEELGLIKMDFLGLRNLTIIDDIVQRVNQRQPLDIMKIPLDDARTYALLKKVDTVGIFQLESEGMKNLIRKMQPECFDDIVATIALFRPGPMENIPEYLRCRTSPSAVHYLHPDLKPILESTYGVMIYQEQIMQTAQKMAGFSLGRADVLRRAMSKKKLKELQSLQKEFIGGCIQQGYDEKLANEVYELILKFANYGFNKSHSVAYGLLAYQLSYLKANFPLEFYTSLLNSVIGAEGKTAEYIDECRRHQVQILGPSVNASDVRYLIEGNAIRYPLLGIKNIGSAACLQLLAERQEKGPFADYYDFVTRMLTRRLNRKMIEALIDAGALDEFHANRQSLRLSLEEAISYGDLVRIEVGGQVRIDLGLVSKPVMVMAKEDPIERSEREREALGFYLCSHPILQIKKKYQIQTEPLIRLLAKGGYIEGFVYLQRVRQHRTKKGDLMAFAVGVDETAQIDLVIMPNIYARSTAFLNKGQYVYFQGKMDKEDSCLVNRLQPLNPDFTQNSQ
ncbi:DNA polymerase III subunit alpha [Holdemania massiliensis]|uniref:DNA polymerase III subunit alpha n=1 Tax=Holdemania massiliensis TaxID=1468449 RepID=UPI003520783F